MSEISLTIPCGNRQLEARLDDGNGAAAVICHPHPLFGGSMDSNVVDVLQRSLHEGGLRTLRFNFRGVGGSTGHHQGAQTDTDDLLAVCRYLGEQGLTPIHLAGYSYGAWIGLRAMKDGLSPETSILVSPPLDFLDFRGLTPPSGPCLITVGTQDEFCTATSVKTWISSRSGIETDLHFESLPGCDHFYWGFEKHLAEKVRTFLRVIRN